jgi:hypothetical protein
VRFLRGFEPGLLPAKSALGLGELLALPRPHPDEVGFKFGDYR